MLTTEILYRAGLDLLDETCRSEHEDDDSQMRLPEACMVYGSDRLGDEDIKRWLESVMTPEIKLELVATIAYLVGNCSRAWRHDVGLVFYHMGLDNEKEKADGVYYLLMGCFGHGISLADYSYDRHEALEKAEAKLSSISPVTFEPSPCYFDQHQELSSMADQFMESRDK